MQQQVAKDHFEPLRSTASGVPTASTVEHPNVASAEVASPAEVLGLLSDHYELKSRESPPEIQARLEQQRLDARFDRYKELVLFAVILLGVLGLASICIYILLVPGSSPSSITWAASALTAMISASMTYLLSKSKK